MNAQTKIVATPAVYSAISAVMEHMSKEGISKARKNTQQDYNFRGIDDVYNALASVLAANKLVMLPFVRDMIREERQTKSGGALNYTILTVDFDLVSAEDGSKHTVRTVGEAMDSADKSSNKAQSAALKYAAMEVFMIPTEGDNDADATTHELASARGSGDGQNGGRASSRTGPATDQQAQITKIIQLCEAVGDDQSSKVCKAYKVKDFRELTSTQAAAVIKRLTEKLAEKAHAPTNAEFSEITEADCPF